MGGVRRVDGISHHTLDGKIEERHFSAYKAKPYCGMLWVGSQLMALSLTWTRTSNCRFMWVKVPSHADLEGNEKAHTLNRWQLLPELNVVCQAP